jgi:tRNA(His) 5'-end guanylyltransferase
MKKGLLALSLIMLMGTALFTACEKDEDNPDYVGTWEYSEMGFKQTIELKKSSFKSTASMAVGDVEVKFQDMEGDLSVDGQNVTITFTKITEYFDDNFQELDSPNVITDEATIMEYMGTESTTVEGEYSVSGDQLTLKTDMDGDGEYDGEDEVQVLTKV